MERPKAQSFETWGFKKGHICTFSLGMRPEGFLKTLFLSSLMINQKAKYWLLEVGQMDLYLLSFYIDWLLPW